MSFEFPCTHPDNWPCKESNIHPGRCGTQEIYDAAMGSIDGHYALNPDGSAGVGEVESRDSEMHKTGWTGNGQEVTLDAEEQERWAFRSFGDDQEHDDFEAWDFWRAAQRRAPEDPH
ncbi:Uncharacterised protein [Mycobacteroides abscessus subsp. massiliense]|mgnify:CR=1 FL=1|uniref:hypothetical protein n=1 Tax=Mycobacteroides abscessus TaxID=36809 RepID=UPI0009A5B84C|nr:hypothetical protein [Mycobacteroides abscessus]SKM24439.1 Uncharacterised protein [Mycobacteroides abscessus subsp. massiliense]SKM72327.1 Uncharacterised protein [Mycobacteroides abscessus subsp. massiliense]SKN08684.1 Uncharacterised protein [Mycobacteroides abscessus subsp. massiliense]SKN16371.1 Uncharacterised protein [Mycobacteroides abscessus subsp. massiliense]SKN26071.1 Uncharacterised protein [Mycobacteroides abscessus subsp. massiliense]